MRAEASRAALEEMSGCVCFTLRRAARVVTQHHDRALRAHGVRVTQLPILVAAARRGSVPLAELAPFLGMERTTLLRNVRPLVRRRLLEVTLDAPSRRTQIRATASGHALLARLYPAWKRAQARTLKSLRGSDVSRSLDALIDALRSVR